MVNPIIKQQQDKSATNFSGKLIVRTSDSNQGNYLLNVIGMCLSHFPLDFNKSKLLVIFNSTTNTHSTWILRSFQGCNEARLSRIIVFQDHKSTTQKRDHSYNSNPILLSIPHNSDLNTPSFFFIHNSLLSLFVVFFSFLFFLSKCIHSYTILESEL